jgi:hypothetical protein
VALNSVGCCALAAGTDRTCSTQHHITHACLITLWTLQKAVAFGVLMATSHFDVGSLEWRGEITKQEQAFSTMPQVNGEHSQPVPARTLHQPTCPVWLAVSSQHHPSIMHVCCKRDCARNMVIMRPCTRCCCCCCWCLEAAGHAAAPGVACSSQHRRWSPYCAGVATAVQRDGLCCWASCFEVKCATLQFTLQLLQETAPSSRQAGMQTGAQELSACTQGMSAGMVWACAGVHSCVPQLLQDCAEPREACTTSFLLAQTAVQPHLAGCASARMPFAMMPSALLMYPAECSSTAHS